MLSRVWKPGGATSGPREASTYQCVPSDDASAQAAPATGNHTGVPLAQ